MSLTNGNKKNSYQNDVILTIKNRVNQKNSDTRQKKNGKVKKNIDTFNEFSQSG